MPVVIPVRMHFNTQDLWFDPAESGAAAGDHVIVTTERGTEFGLATDDPFEVETEELRAELKPVLRIATDEDIAKAEELAERGDDAMSVFRSLVKKSGLDMKPVGVEFLFGGEKVIFYFAAEDRVDFRELVRELASHFHQRVDMRQIGVRDEARLMGGYAPCGQILCCVRFGSDFEPVSIRMAKEQDLPLKSAKISGVCGRLMCCLRYEFDAYRDFKQRAPKKNALIDTPLGIAKVVEHNTPRETLVLRLENGKTFTVALKDMTCSENCYRRCAEQHIPLRPDTVERSVLEEIGTPDIAMMLAELDRSVEEALGPVEPESPRSAGPSEFAKAPQGRERTAERTSERPAERAGERKSARSTDQSGERAAERKNEPQTTRHTRRHHSTNEATQKVVEQRSARTRQNTSGTKAGTQNSSASSSTASSSSGISEQTSATVRRHNNRYTSQNTGQTSGSSSSTSDGRTRRRRPGDRGGQIDQ